MYTTDEMNAFNQYTEYTLGNGLTTQRTYDDYGRVTGISDGTVQNLAMSWIDNTGNLQLRADLSKNRLELFGHDDLDRLYNAQVFDPPTGSNVSGNTLGYDANGNIQSKTDVGAYQYNSPKPPAFANASAGRHAVTDVDNPDGLISSLTQDIDYTPFNKTEKITEGDYELLFTYGTDHERKKTVLNYQSNTRRTITYSGNYEQIEDAVSGDTYEVHYLGNGAINVRHNGNDHLFYAYTDHLGSITAITDAAGNVIYEQNFDPWGRERDPDTWDYTAGSYTKPAWLIRGFTGHEHLDEFALINMNGRMYDPILGRVLSPDNFVQDNTSTQGYNRYSYALNNPLVYTDPTGEVLVPAAIIAIKVAIVLAGAYGGGVATNQGELNPGQWDWNSGSTYAGIAGGAFVGYLGGYWLFNPGSVSLGVGVTTPAASVYAVGQGSDWSLQWTNEAGGQGQIDLNKPVTAGDLLAGSNESVNYYAGGYEETSTVYDPQMAAALARQAGAEVRVGPLKTVGVIGGEIYTEPYNPIIEAIYQGQRDFLHHPVTQMTISLLPVGGMVGGAARGYRAVSYATQGYRYKVGLHSAHHTFRQYGKLKHFQLTVWKDGVKGSHKNYYLALPWK